jgi:pimeloyl-ACP methyl ester carboxylesterase
MSTELFSAVSGNIDDFARPLIILCHGSMDRSAGMLRLSRRLEEAAVVIRYDRRGYAKSRDIGPPYGVDEQIADLALVLDRYAPGRSVDLAFGHSFGGNVVLGLAAQRPELIARTAVYETPLSWLDWWPNSGAGGAAAQAASPQDAAEAFMRRLVGDERWERLPQAIQARRRAEGEAMVAELGDLRRAAPWNPDDVRCPVLAVSGDKGRLHHQRGMQLLAGMLPRAVFARLNGAGHGAPNTHPTELSMLLREWLSREID